MNEIYKILRKRFPLNTKATHHFGKLLISYQKSGHAPPHLISELEATGKEGEKNLWSAVWESLLFWHLNSKKFEFVKSRIKKSGQRGPDFGILHQGRTIWIEAAVPGPSGIPPEYLQPPCGIKRPKAWSVPHDQKLLRWTSEIKDKKDKIIKYLDEGIISSDDCIVIAVNSCRLQDFAFDDIGISRFPYAVEATLPIGPLAISISKDDKAAGSAENTLRLELTKENGIKIATDAFLNDEYKIISGVLGSHQRDLWQKENLHLSLVHNPLANTPLPEQIIGATKEFVCELSEDKFTLRNILK